MDVLSTNIATSGNYLSFQFSSSNAISLGYFNGEIFTTSAVYRDFSAWMHVVLALDTTLATAADRVKLYVNGSRVTTFSTDNISSVLTQNSDQGINAVQSHSIGRNDNGANVYFDGYLAEVFLIDGQQLDPSSFTTTDLTTGQLIPKAYTGGSYGTNGFKLNFSDNSTTAALGTDTSSNGNTWTTNNFSVTAGSGNDSLVDTPTSYGTDTGVGNEVRGNYATLNALDNGGLVLTEGNLGFSLPSAGNWRTARGTIFVTSGKWYWEVTANTYVSGGVPFGFGIADATALLTNDIGSNAGGWVYESNGNKKNNGSSVSYGASWTTGNIIGVALDMDNGTVVFYKNGASQGTAYSSGLSGKAIAPIVGLYPGETSGTAYCNFGQRAFAYTAPSGFKALVDTNLPAPVVAKSNTVMDVVLYTGTGAALTPTSSLGFNPDWIWIKGRSGATDHALYDVVRGAQARLESNTTDAEVTTDGGVTAFNSAGFTLGTLAQVNTSSATYAAWCWDAGTNTVTNNSGSISSQVRANATAGFSVVSFTGTGSVATVGHGLGVAPAFMIFKNRSASGTNWFVYHQSLGATKYLLLDSTVGQDTSSTVFNNTNPTSSIFTVGTWVGTNGSGNNMISYCFSPVSGYSSFGSYTGGGTSGRFVYTGFRPKLIWVKNYNDNSYPSYTGWYMWDSVRGAYNYNQSNLNANSSNNEGIRNTGGAIGTIGIDLLSNGFCLRGSDDVDTNWGSGQYIYCAWAESPFQYARAR
jgi:hypothetical protein